MIKSPTDFNNIIEIATYFNSEEKCLKYLEQWLHDDDIKCAYCGFDKPYRYSDGKSFRCSSCQSLFTLKVGTVFEDSKLPLVKWFMAIYLLVNNKKGISSYQLARHIGVTQKTAWYISHKIRKAFKQEDDKLKGEVQIDETFVGGKNKGRHIHKKVKNSHDRTFKDKVTVIGFLDQNKKLKTEKNRGELIWSLSDPKWFFVK